MTEPINIEVVKRNQDERKQWSAKMLSDREFDSILADVDALVAEVNRLMFNAEWMICDAETIRDAIRNGCICGDYPHETRAREKLERLLNAIAPVGRVG